MSVTVVDNVITLTLSTGQGPAGAPPRVDITEIHYDGSDRVIDYLQNGVLHEVEYVTDGGGITTATDTGGGLTKTTVTDALGRIVSSTIETTP